jgi:phosphoribosyl 1,2-cyclic phosphodiesterase
MGKLVVRFWGVRGSVPAPGPDTAVYGGNTSCVEVRAGDELFILDMGSGLRALGEQLGAAARGTILISHYHWDHIQGLPFFGPAFDPDSSFDVYGSEREGRSPRELLSGQMVPPYFPVPMSTLSARARFHSIRAGEVVRIGPVELTAAELNHPNGVLGYRLDYAGRALVYATDTEHGTEADTTLVELARGADCLVYDAMYTPEEYEASRKGWGHSTWKAGAQIARRAGVRRLLLFHHDPARSDEALEAILREAVAVHPDTHLAREGATFEL